MARPKKTPVLGHVFPRKAFTIVDLLLYVAHREDAERAAVDDALKRVDLNNLLTTALHQVHAIDEARLANRHPTRDCSESLRAAICEALKRTEEKSERPKSKDHKGQVPRELCMSVLAALDKAAGRRGISANAMANVKGEPARFKALRNAAIDKDKIKFISLATLLYRLELPLDDLFNFAPAPWDTWPPGERIYICVGTRLARTHETAREYEMLQRDDARAAMMLFEYFSRPGMGCKPTIYECEIEPPHQKMEKKKYEDLVKSSKSLFDKLQRQSAGIVVIGSEHANALCGPATQEIRPSGVYRLDFVKQLLVSGSQKHPRSKDDQHDAGLLLIRRGDHKQKPYVTCIAAGLGPAGTLAAAQALTSPYEIACKFNADGLLETGVAVRDTKVFFEKLYCDSPESTWSFVD